MLANSAIIVVLILMLIIFVFWRLIFCPENPSKVFTVSIMFFMEEAFTKSEKKIVSSANGRWFMLKPSLPI